MPAEATQLPEQVPGLTRHQAKLYMHLRTSGPAPCKQLLELVTGRRYGDENAVASHVYRMRPKLAALGIEIRASHKRGYSLALAGGTQTEEAHRG